MKPETKAAKDKLPKFKRIGATDSKTEAEARARKAREADAETPRPAMSMLERIRETTQGVRTFSDPALKPLSLTPDEAATACHLWAALMTGEEAARDQLDEAPANIRAAVAAASKRTLENGDEPKKQAETHQSTP